MARLIDADNLINAIRGATLNFKEMWKRVTIDIIENQPTVELNQWVPVSERLPDAYWNVLICTKKVILMLILLQGKESLAMMM